MHKGPIIPLLLESNHCSHVLFTVGDTFLTILNNQILEGAFYCDCILCSSILNQLVKLWMVPKPNGVESASGGHQEKALYIVPQSISLKKITKIKKFTRDFQSSHYRLVILHHA